jgi:hypothetical protein
MAAMTSRENALYAYEWDTHAANRVVLYSSIMIAHSCTQTLHGKSIALGTIKTGSQNLATITAHAQVVS